MNTSSGKQKTVAVLIYKHRHGEDISVHKNADGAEAQVYAYMDVWMSEVPPPQRPAIKKAIEGKKLREACDDLWREVFGAWDRSETFEIHENLVVQR